jgi:hypothetical protein
VTRSQLRLRPLLPVSANSVTVELFAFDLKNRFQEGIFLFTIHVLRLTPQYNASGYLTSEMTLSILGIAYKKGLNPIQYKTKGGT